MYISDPWWSHFSTATVAAAADTREIGDWTKNKSGRLQWKTHNTVRTIETTQANLSLGTDDQES